MKIAEDRSESLPVIMFVVEVQDHGVDELSLEMLDDRVAGLVFPGDFFDYGLTAGWASCLLNSPGAGNRRISVLIEYIRVPVPPVYRIVPQTDTQGWGGGRLTVLSRFRQRR